MTGNPIYQTARWKQLRRQVLDEEPECRWCLARGKRTPSTQCDHIVELDRQGDPYDRSNLCGSCARCNSSRGATYINRKTAQRIQTRNQTTQKTDKVFLTDQLPTPSPHLAFPPNQPEPARSAEKDLLTGLIGRDEPRLVTRVPEGSSYGDQIVAWSQRVIGLKLMGWQARAVRDALTVDADGAFVFREALISTARQQGKSILMKSVAGWWATEFAALRKEAQSVVIVANQKKRSMALFRDLAREMEGRIEMKVRWQNGDERIDFPDGSSISVIAASEHAHGGSYDCILIDELWDIKAEVIFTALRPSQIAKTNPMMLMFSTAGDLSSTAMIQLRSQGIAAIDSGKDTAFYLAEWSPPPGVSVEDRQWWPWANPALGTTITMKALELAFDSPNRQAFIRGHLNLWIASAEAWLPLTVWDRQHTAELMPEGGHLVIDSSLDGSRYVGIRAAMSEGHVILETAFSVDSEAQMWGEVVRIMADPKIMLGVTPSLEIHTPPDLRRRMTIVGYAELIKWTAMARSMIVEDRVRHTGDIGLAEHMGRAVAVKTNQSIVLSSQKSPGPIELARCAVFAIALESRPAQQKKPMIAFY